MTTLSRNLIANYFGVFLSNILNLLFIPVYVHYLGVESYGFISVIGILQAWFGLLDLGLTPALSREMSLFSGGAKSIESIRDLIRSVELVTLFFVSLIIVLGYYGSDLLSKYWFKSVKLETSTSNFIFTIFIIVSLRFFEGVYRGIISGLQNHVLLNIVSSFLSIMRSIGSLLLLKYISTNLDDFLLWQSIISFVSLVVFFFVTYNLLPKIPRSARFSLIELKQVWAYASGIISLTLVTLALTQIDKLLLSKKLSISEFGIYGLATTISSIPALIIGPIIAAFTPKFTELIAQKDENQVIQLYHVSTQLVNVLVSTFVAVLVIFPELFISIWLRTSAYNNSLIPILRVMLISTLFWSAWVVPHNIQLSFGWTTLNVKINFFSLFVVVPMMFIVIPYFGAIGASFIYLVLHLSYVTIGAKYMYNKILVTEKKAWYINDLFLPTLVAFMCVTIFYLVFKIPSYFLGKVIVLGLISIVTFTVTLISSNYLRHIIKPYLFSLK